MEVQESINTLFKRIDELKLRQSELEKEVKSAKDLAIYTARSQAELTGILKEHKAIVEGIISKWKSELDFTIKNNFNGIENKVENYKKSLEESSNLRYKEFEVMLRENTNKTLKWIFSGGFVLLVIAEILRLI